jgi:transcriptional regulator with XRE-family HTH domain
MSSEKYSQALNISAVSKKLKEIKGSGRFGNYKKMAARLGISQQHLSDLVAGRKNPSIQLIKSMENMFQIPLNQLIEREENFFVAESSGAQNLTEAGKTLVEKVKKLVLVAEDDVILALLQNVEQFQEKTDALRELKELKKK